MYDLYENLSALTRIKPSLMEKIKFISENCICDYTLDIIEQDDDVVMVDIGIGTLQINISDYELDYKFIPSNGLEKKLIRTIEEEQSPLVREVEKKLNNKITATYKELV